jgi:sulfur carrier protein ThiS
MQDTDEPMNIHVKLFSRFRAHLPAEARGEATVELPRGATVGDLLDHLTITGRVKAIAVNGDSEEDRGRVLQDGDAVRIFPFVVGG